MTGVLGHWLLLGCHEVAEASAEQPFACAQLVFAAAVGIAAFQVRLEDHVVLGVKIMVGAGLLTLWRERQKA